MTNIIQRTLEALMVPAGIIQRGGEVLSMNHLLLGLLGMDDQEDWDDQGLTSDTIITRAGYTYTDTCLSGLLLGKEPDLSLRYIQMLGADLWGVASWVPRLADREQCALWTVETAAMTGEQAVEMHTRSRSKILNAKALDELVTQSNMVAILAAQSAQQAKRMAQRFVDGLPTLAEDLLILAGLTEPKLPTQDPTPEAPDRD